MAFVDSTSTKNNEFLNRLEVDVEEGDFIDHWDSGELLFLASSVLRSDRNWASVARSIKPYGEQTRPSDWYTPKISKTLLYEIVAARLGYRKFCARWVPKILTDHHKSQRMASALDFLSRYEDEGEPLLNRIVTGDETWIKYVNPETKEQSKMWAHSDSPTNQKKPGKIFLPEN
ncbi:Bromodomain-containing protein 8 [Argiope bruennichi]|uniref:Bromodomain-containing protein 8 n=1 Tax=Argiope bruennichi TaxID=94029 RepID=A0A8T0E4D5_ARGBR|nr:Bromodomain-containing protein 8 [Argiope bruennichi]